MDVSSFQCQTSLMQCFDMLTDYFFFLLIFADPIWQLQFRFWFGEWTLSQLFVLVLCRCDRDWYWFLVPSFMGRSSAAPAYHQSQSATSFDCIGNPGNVPCWVKKTRSTTIHNRKASKTSLCHQSGYKLPQKQHTHYIRSTFIIIKVCIHLKNIIINLTIK